jgi:hypothetical protein
VARKIAHIVNWMCGAVSPPSSGSVLVCLSASVRRLALESGLDGIFVWPSIWPYSSSPPALQGGEDNNMEEGCPLPLERGFFLDGQLCF